MVPRKYQEVHGTQEVPGSAWYPGSARKCMVPRKYQEVHGTQEVPGSANDFKSFIFKISYSAIFYQKNVILSKKVYHFRLQSRVSKFWFLFTFVQATKSEQKRKISFIFGKFAKFVPNFRDIFEFRETFQSFVSNRIFLQKFLITHFRKIITLFY